MIRMSIQLGDFSLHNLIFLSRIYEKKRAPIAALIIDEYLKDQVEIIERAIQQIAESGGITSEELKKRWIEEEFKNGDDE